LLLAMVAVGVVRIGVCMQLLIGVMQLSSCMIRGGAQSCVGSAVLLA
jgi:hypothetical protein